MDIQYAPPQIVEVNVRTFGATGGGVTDDRAAIQAALDAATALGGATVVIPPGDYLLSSSFSGGGITWQLAISGDDLTIRWEPGARLLSSVAAARPLVAIGGGRIGGMAQWFNNENRDATLYTLSGAQAKADDHVTLATPAEAANFQAGNVVWVRTGQLLTGGVTEPDSELNEVVSSDTGTGVVKLRWPLTKDYAQEYFISGTTGKTSTTPTANPAPYGLANVTDRTMRNLTLINPQIEATGTVLQTLSIWQCLNFRSVGGRVLYPVNGLGSRDTRFAEITGGYFERQSSDGSSGYVVAPSTGCTNWDVHDCELVANEYAYLHIHEGIAASGFHDNRIACGKVDSTQTVIHIAARSRDVDVYSNLVWATYTGEGNVISVDSDCTGGRIANNRVYLGATKGNIRIDGDGWVGLETNYLSNGRTSLRGAQISVGHQTSVQVLSGWLTFSRASVALGALPRHAIPLRVQCYVKTAFNSDGTDVISVGFSGSAGTYATVDVSATGVKSPTAGAGLLIPDETAQRAVVAGYAAGGSAASAGEAFVVLEYALVARSD